MKNKIFILTIVALISPTLASAEVSINWGVPAGQPVFSISNMTPGQSITRSVSVANPEAITQNLSVQGISSSDSGHLADVLLLTITEGSRYLYGPIPLSQFFTTGFSLSPLKSNAQTSYNFTVLFDPQAGNAYQHTSLTFDLALNSATPTPQKCSGLRDPRLIRDCVNNNFRYRYYLFITEFNRRIAELAARLSNLMLPFPR